MQLKDKVVLVTGGGRGLGRAYAEAMAAEGAAVVAGDIRNTSETVASIEATGGQALGLELDVTDMASCQNMADQAVEKFGRVDILVNNAALYGDISGGRFDQLSDEQWDSVMNVNVKGIWQCCKGAVPAMRDAGGGSTSGPGLSHGLRSHIVFT